MSKLNGLLALLLVLCALALVTSQHKARKLFSELAQERDIARQVDEEWGQLQLEQSTWAMHARIERIASSRLQMRVPASAQTRVVSTGGDVNPALQRNGPVVARPIEGSSGSVRVEGGR